MSPPSAKLAAAARRLSRDIDGLAFEAPVSHVYNPLDYARKPHLAYLKRFADTTKRVLFLGMNPGPFGMAQTGVPFGDVAIVRDWLGIEAPVARPDLEHPKRPVEGFGCTRSEVSGTRLWGAIEAHFGTPDGFFRDHFITNYCPLVFIESGGRNRTPDKLPKAEREPLYAACDRHLRRVIDVLEPEWVVGIGAFAEARVRELGLETLRIGRILHPSPANPRAQKDWGGKARDELVALGVCRRPGTRKRRKR